MTNFRQDFFSERIGKYSWQMDDVRDGKEIYQSVQAILLELHFYRFGQFNSNFYMIIVVGLKNDLFI